jgi:hypothetical protein
MPAGPKPIFRRGEPIPAASLQRLVDEVWANRFLGISGGSAVQSPNGFHLAVAPSSSSGTSTEILPFAVRNATTEEDGARVRVYTGIIAALDPVAAGPFSTGDTTPKYVSITTGGVVYVALTCAYDSASGLWSATSFTVGTATTLPAGNATTAYYPLKTVSYAAGELTLAGGVTGNIGWQRCGDGSTYSDQYWLAP